MSLPLPPDKMPEAEVSLRLAFCLLNRGIVDSDIEVAIEGAQVRTKKTVHFPIEDFMASHGWSIYGGSQAWQGRYRHPEHQYGIVIHSNPGRGDVVATLTDGKTLRAESKKGPLIKTKASREYPLIREALGQLMTVEQVGNNDILAVVVPSSDKFTELARRWRKAPLISRFGIRIVTVDRNNQVKGLFDD